MVETRQTTEQLSPWTRGIWLLSQKVKLSLEVPNFSVSVWLCAVIWAPSLKYHLLLWLCVLLKLFQQFHGAKNQNMEVPLEKLWRHMNEIWALFCFNVPQIKCRVDVKRTGFQQRLLVFPQKLPLLHPPHSPLRRMVLSNQRVHSYSGADWEKNSSSGAALFKHNSFFPPSSLL